MAGGKRGLKSAGLALGRFLKQHRNRFPTDASFAEAIQCSGGRLSQLLKGQGGQPSPPLAIAIHKESAGAVPGNLLRPDLWRSPEDVPVDGGSR